MIVNVIHRPATGKLHEMFLLQQDIAHGLGLKVTVLVPYDFLFEEQIVNEIKAFRMEYGDEVGVWFGEIAGGRMNEVFECREPFLWLHSRENKGLLITTVFEKFREVFGHMPVVAGSYHVDTVSMQLMKKLSPALKACIAGCFEEGVKVFHGCNNSWYLFNEGMPWGPWYPSNHNTLCPAESASDWNGVVAVPHLSRDLALSFEGRNDFFASHPANVQRAMANDGPWAPYTHNLLDMYRYQERYNEGFSYTNVFVGPNWLRESPNVQDSDEITQALYREYLSYFAQLRDQGCVTDMHMGEFADWYREHRPIGKAEVHVAKDILYGSGKQYVWYLSPCFRVTLDLCQGGSIGDLRPYVSKQYRCTGAETEWGAIGSNPYLIQSQYRTGNAHHYEDGARTTLLVCHKGQTKDLADCPVKIADVQNGPEVCRVELTPAAIVFDDGYTADITTVYDIHKNGGVQIHRRLNSTSDLSVRLAATEYCKGCWGVTEYPEPMEGITLYVEYLEGRELQRLEYRYLGRTLSQSGKHCARVSIPALETELLLQPDQGDFYEVKVSEGYRFNPYYVLQASAEISQGEEISTWLKVRKAK